MYARRRVATNRRTRVVRIRHTGTSRPRLRRSLPVYRRRLVRQRGRSRRR